MSNVETTTTKTFPNGALIYAARFEENMTWSEMRAHFSVSARSSRFLAECVAFVQQDAGLLEKHPEFAAIDGEAATDVENDAYVATREFIRTERSRGVGLALLAERTGLKMAVLKRIVGDEVGTTARVAWGARYGGRKAPVTEEGAEPTEEPTETVVEETVAETVAEPAKTTRRRKPRAKAAAKK